MAVRSSDETLNRGGPWRYLCDFVRGALKAAVLCFSGGALDIIGRSGAGLNRQWTLPGAIRVAELPPTNDQGSRSLTVVGAWCAHPAQVHFRFLYSDSSAIGVLVLPSSRFLFFRFLHLAWKVLRWFIPAASAAKSSLETSFRPRANTPSPTATSV